METKLTGQGMTYGVLKTVVFSLFALMLSAGHSVCADGAMTAFAATENLHAADEAPPRHSEMEMAHHAGDQRHLSGPDAPCENDSGCTHCDAAQFFKTALKIELSPVESNAGFIATETFAYADQAAAADPRAAPVAERIFAPPISSPVALKIRLLT